MVGVGQDPRHVAWTKTPDPRKWPKDPEVALQEMWAITPLAHNSIWAAARPVSARRRSLAALSGCGSRLDRFLDLS